MGKDIAAGTAALVRCQEGPEALHDVYGEVERRTPDMHFVIS
jgi:hypothetical protein